MLLKVIRQRWTSPSFTRALRVLALESSADDTCAAVVDSDRNILSNIVIPQNAENYMYGGINPRVAISSHQRNMPLAVRRALQDAQLDMSGIDGIAFTRGPGIGGCLAVACNAAKTLAAALNKPVVGVHHMQAHALTPFLTSPQPPRFPFLTLLVSGGHTLLLLAEAADSFTELATTVDVSIGNAFDKVSRLLDIPRDPSISAGAALEQFCLTTTLEDPPPLYPLPLKSKMVFSYACLISHTQRYLASLGPGQLTVPIKTSLARAFQEAAVGQLEEKLHLALEWCGRKQITPTCVVVSGGVASNLFLKQRLISFLLSSGGQLELLYPPPDLCTDNAAMIAWASMGRFLRCDLDSFLIGPLSSWSLSNLRATNTYNNTKLESMTLDMLSQSSPKILFH